MSRVTWDDLVFENRNKEYGAYSLRRSYSGTIALAFVAALLVLAAVMAYPFVRKFFAKEVVQKEHSKQLKYSEMVAPPPIDVTKPPPPTINLPPPPPETVKFLPPRVTDKVVEEENLPTIDDLKKVEPASETQAGDADFISDEPVVAAIQEEGEDPNKVYTIVQQQPEFPGGVAAMMKYIASHMKYPASARRMGTEGSVFVSFVVEPDGRISEVTTIKGISADCDKEATRVIQSMPAWKPGKQNGKAVRVRFVLPLKFMLST